MGGKKIEKYKYNCENKWIVWEKLNFMKYILK